MNANEVVYYKHKHFIIIIDHTNNKMDMVLQQFERLHSLLHKAVVDTTTEEPLRLVFLFRISFFTGHYLIF